MEVRFNAGVHLGRSQNIPRFPQKFRPDGTSKIKPDQVADAFARVPRPAIVEAAEHAMRAQAPVLEYRAGFSPQAAQAFMKKILL